MKKKALGKKRKPAAKKSSAESYAIHLGNDIWPIERDILFRPDRLKYVRKLIKTPGCVFCEAQKSGVNFKSLILYKSKLSMVVMNKFPYNPGHVLVLPQRHCGEFLRLTDAEYMDLQLTKRKVFAAIYEAYSPVGTNIGLNHGAVAGAGIPEHLHYHIVPRWTGDMNFFPLIADTKALPMDLKDSYNKLYAVLHR